MKFLSGVLMGAILTSVVFMYFTKTNKVTTSEPVIPNSSLPVSTNMYEPKPEDDNNKLNMKPSGAVTFLLSADNEIYYYKGIFNKIINKTDYAKVGLLIKKYHSEINPDDLMFIIKSDQGASFKNAIDILDQMTINKIPPGHYAEIEITKEEIDGINILKNTKNG